MRLIVESSSRLNTTLCPTLVAGQTLQISALVVAGGSALACFGSDYLFLALALIGCSAAAGILNGNTPAMLADRSQDKYHGTGIVLILPSAADQVAFIVGPYAGASICRYASFQTMCQIFGGCLLLYAAVLLLFACVRQDEVFQSEATEPRTPHEASRAPNS